jgi:hypothetical protein
MSGYFLMSYYLLTFWLLTGVYVLSRVNPQLVCFAARPAISPRLNPKQARADENRRDMFVRRRT